MDGGRWMAEAEMLSGHTQLTFRDRFVKAGEAYFGPDGSRIIFQAVPVPPEGEDSSPHYSMYVADLRIDELSRPTGLANVRRISPKASANTCGWVHPNDEDVVLFGSTLAPPAEDDQPGYQRGTGRYEWQFPKEMEIVRAELGGEVDPTPMFERRGYTAEASWSPEGRHVLYAQVDPEKSRGLGRPDADLFVFDTKTETHTPLVVADGYDGGPFFSPDGRWICYRSDRRGDNLLQLFIAELAFEDAEDPGLITGIEREVQLTDNRHVNWAPYWHSSGDFLVYTTSRLGHFNYEVFALPVFGDDGSVLKDAGHTRVTEASGFDGLPVFSPDGRYLMWTSQRGDSGSSQVWIADVQEGGWSDLMSHGGGDR